MAFFTDFSVRGNVGLLDWYTVSMGVVVLIFLAAHGATYLTLKTEGPVHDRCLAISRWLWALMPVLFILISVATAYVRPTLAQGLMQNPLAWLGVLVFLAGVVALISGLHDKLEMRAFIGSGMIIIGLLISGAAATYPVIFFSTLAPENSLTADNTAASLSSLELALIWWPLALVMTLVYFRFISRQYTGKVKLTKDTQGYY